MEIKYPQSATKRVKEYCMLVAAIAKVSPYRVYLTSDGIVKYGSESLILLPGEIQEINKRWQQIVHDVYYVVGVGEYAEWYLNKINRQYGLIKTSREGVLVTLLGEGESLDMLQNEVQIGVRSLKTQGAIIANSAILEEYWKQYREIEIISDKMFVKNVTEYELYNSALRLSEGLIPRRMIATPAVRNRGVDINNLRVVYKAMAILLLGSITGEMKELEQVDITKRGYVLIPISTPYTEVVFRSLWRWVKGQWNRIKSVREWYQDDYEKENVLKVTVDNFDYGVEVE